MSVCLHAVGRRCDMQVFSFLSPPVPIQHIFILRWFRSFATFMINKVWFLRCLYLKWVACQSKMESLVFCQHMAQGVYSGHFVYEILDSPPVPKHNPKYYNRERWWVNPLCVTLRSKILNQNMVDKRFRNSVYRPVLCSLWILGTGQPAPTRICLQCIIAVCR